MLVPSCGQLVTIQIMDKDIGEDDTVDTLTLPFDAILAGAARAMASSLMIVWPPSWDALAHPRTAPTCRGAGPPFLMWNARRDRSPAGCSSGQSRRHSLLRTVVQ